MKRLSLCFLLPALCSALNAQGFLPPQSTATVAATDVPHSLLIGEKVPETLLVMDENGKKRNLLSYKSPTEVMVVTFLTLHCEDENAQWPALRRLQERYKDWRVSLVAVSESSPDILTELRNTLHRERLPWPVLHDEERAAATLLKIMGTPEILVIDEYGVLKYRGPISKVKQALDTVIGHLDEVKEPEPPFDGKCSL